MSKSGSKIERQMGREQIRRALAAYKESRQRPDREEQEDQDEEDEQEEEGQHEARKGSRPPKWSSPASEDFLTQELEEKWENDGL